MKTLLKKGRPSPKKGQKSPKKGQERLFTVLEWVYEHPESTFSIRKISHQLNIPRSTTQKILGLLRKKRMVSTENQFVDNWKNRMLKTHYYLEKIVESGLIDYLEEELAASAIILFGSFRKGESNFQSDIDLFVECAKEKKLDLKPFENKLKHKIELFTKTKIVQLPESLLNNVLNGIKIKGYFTLK